MDANTETATAVAVIIGGKRLVLPPMTFAQLKRAWPAIEAVGKADNRINLTDAALEIVIVLLPNETVESLSEQLLTTEIDGLLGQVPVLLRISGLMAAGDPEPGEVQAGT